jgi:tetratricopeptide (TPR) repeat protein
MLEKKLELIEYPSKPLLQVRLFYCYAHGSDGKNIDSGMLDRIDRDTRQLQRQYGIVGWSDRQIPIGADWEQRIFSEIDFADIILLLLSPDFISSDYCMEKELPRALHKQQNNSALVIPIILRPCAWEDEELLSKLQVLPGGGIPISDFDQHSEQEHVYLEIAQHIKTAVKEILTKKWDYTLNAGFTHIEAGHFADAKYIFDELIEFYRPFLNKTNEFLSFCSQAYCGLGIALRELKSYKEAFMAFQEALRLAPSYARAWCEQGVTFREDTTSQRTFQEDMDDAFHCFKKAIKLQSNFALAYFEQGVTLRQIGQLPSALNSFDSAIHFNPDFAPSYLEKGIVLRRLNKQQEAIVTFQEALQRKPDYPEAYYQQGITLHDRNSTASVHSEQLDKALQMFESAIVLKSDFALAHFEKGIILYKLQKYGEARLAFSQTLLSKPNFALAYYELGKTYIAENQPLMAIEDFRKAIDMQFEYAPLYYEYSCALKKSAKLEDALSAIEYALYLNSSCIPYYHEKGEMQISLHKYADALVTYEQILNLDKTNEKAYCRKGLVLSQLERYPESIISYDEAISLNANSPDPYFGKREVYIRLAEQADAKGKSL